METGNAKQSPEKYSTIDFKLLPGERIINIENMPPRVVTKAPGAIGEMVRLARSRLSQSIGDNGPVLAALSRVRQNGEVDDSPDLHRYEALFGRDSLRVAMNLMTIYPNLARATIFELAKLQGQGYNSASEEEPGRIIHESREEGDAIRESLTKELGWKWPYYGSVDSTPEYVRTLIAYCKSSPEGFGFLNEHFEDRNGQRRLISESLISAVDWIRTRMDGNPEGLIESYKSSPHGIDNQMWKDSWDAYFHADGTIANHNQGVSSIEVQRVTYDALIDAADVYDSQLELTTDAKDLRFRAKRLKQNIFDIYWVDDPTGYFALGSDRDANGNVQPFKIRTSNMGHMLNSALLDGGDIATTMMRESVVRNLFSDEMLASSGVRTLASNEVRYRPGSYHNGSVWPWDNYFIIQGLKRQGYYRLADNLALRLLNIINTTNIFPEFVRGNQCGPPEINSRIIDVWDENYDRSNRVEQVPQEVQAWSVAAILAIKYSRQSDDLKGKELPMKDLESSILSQSA